MAENLTDIQDFVAACEVAWNARHAKTITELFCEAGDLLVGNGPRTEGRSAIRAWWVQYFSTQDTAGRNRLSIDSIQLLSADVVLVNLHARVSGPGVPPTEDQMTWVLCRENRRWRIAAMRGQSPTTIH